MIDMSRGELQPDLYPTVEILKAVNSVHQEGSAAQFLSYGPEPRGDRALIGQIRCLRPVFSTYDDDEFVVTFGATHALDLVFSTLVRSSNDVVVVERPSYRWALENVDRVGGTICSIPVDQDGMDVAELKRLLDVDTGLAAKLKIVYVMPTLQNPSGVCMSIERRRLLMELADHYGFYVVEDDAYSELSSAGHKNGLAQYDSSRKLIHIGSFSKTIAPGIRLGWMASQTGIAQRIGTWLPNAANPYLSAVVRQILASRALESQIIACRQQLGIRCRITVELLRELCPNISFLEPEGGFFVFCQLPAGVSEERLLTKCREAGVLIMPGRGFVRGDTSSRGHLRICFARVDTTEIERGIMILADRLHALECEAANAS